MLTDLMGGEMTVTQHARASARCFAIRLFLPRGRAPAVAERALPRVGAAPATPGARRRILVVDNEEVDRGLLVSLLQPLGFEVLQAGSGEEAWRCCATARGPTRS